MPMHHAAPESAMKMRALAARLRAHAAETSLVLYRRKFESVASELEEGAIDAESRVRSRDTFRLVS